MDFGFASEFDYKYQTQSHPIQRNTENYDDSLGSRREGLKQENPETSQDTFAQSEYAYENAKQQLSTAYDASQKSKSNEAAAENLASLSNAMQGFGSLNSSIHLWN